MSGFDHQPRLDGPRLSLRPMTAGDWPALFAAASDPAIWALHPASNRWQELVFRAFFDETLAEANGVVVTDRATGAIIGCSRFSTRFTEAGEIEIGWTFLTRDYWGGDYNRELKRLMIAHVLDSAEAAVFRVGEGNLRSRRAMEKIGGVEIRRWRDPAKPEIPEHVVYAITRAAFADGPLGTS